MKSALDTAITIGPAALLAAVIAVPFYFGRARAGVPRRRISAVRYLMTTLLAGISAYVVGTVAGIAVACSGSGAANLCGLAGVFGSGPLLAALAIVVAAHIQARNARRGT